MLQRSICPVCWRTFEAGEIQVEWPTCPDCYSEAVEVEVLPFDDFVRSKSIADLQEAVRSWQDKGELRESFRKTVVKRIRSVIEVKREAKV
jgi:hypothetical protein